MSGVGVLSYPDSGRRVLALQQAVFKLFAEGVECGRVLEQICLLTEVQLPGVTASYLRYEPEHGQLQLGSAPTLAPPLFSRLQRARFGTLLYRGLMPGDGPLYIGCVQQERRAPGLHSVAAALGIQACWVHPVHHPGSALLGVFVLCLPQSGSPSEPQRWLLEMAAALAGLALLYRNQQRQLETDHLTGLPNAGRLRQALSGAADPAVLMLLNLNNLSYLNSAYGIDFGDALLRACAQRLQAFAPEGCEVYRSNADEFVLLYRGLPDAQLDDELERLQRSFRAQPFCVGALSLFLTFNVGVGSGADCHRQAMRALKWSRKQGKNRSHVYRPLPEELSTAQRLDYLLWNSRLYSALESGGIEAWFQGIRDNRSGEINKWEVLVRLRHGQEIATPGQFLDVAQLCGLMPSITRTVITQAFAAIADSARQISLNITEDDLSLGYLPDFLDRCSHRYGVPAQQVTLELLEGVSSGSKQDQTGQLRELKRRGYRLAIDDFGTEYSNFERILELEIDTLKIDAKYIRDIDRDRTRYEVVRAICFFARNAGIRTVAECVHSASVQAVVERLGIDESQGYLFSEPSPRFGP